MPTSPIPELEPKRKPEPELKRPRKPEPELKQPRKPEPEIEQPTTPAKPEVGEDQGPVDREDAHIGATENQVSDTTAPAGDAFKDEPRQG
jgi:hypothetical protein